MSEKSVNISIDMKKVKEYKQSMKNMTPDMKNTVINQKAMGCFCACCNKVRNLIRFVIPESC